MGRVVAERSGEVKGAPVKLLTIDVDQHIKGDVGGPVEVRTPSATDCDVEVPMNKAIGLLLTKSPEGVWLASACSVVEPGPLVAAGGEPRGGAIKVGRRNRHPRARPRVGPSAPAQGKAAEPAGRARAVDLDSGRAVRARPRGRRRPDGRGHRAGRRGVAVGGSHFTTRCRARASGRSRRWRRALRGSPRRAAPIRRRRSDGSSSSTRSSPRTSSSRRSSRTPG